MMERIARDLREQYALAYFQGLPVRRLSLKTGWTFLNSATIVANIVMPTSVHLPEPLLEAVDRKARSLRISRNQLVVRALEREVREVSDWSPGFFERLSEREPEIAETVDALVRDVRRARRSKPARQF